MNEIELLDQVKKYATLLMQLKKEYDTLTHRAAAVNKQLNGAKDDLHGAWARLEKEIDANISEDASNESI